MKLSEIEFNVKEYWCSKNNIKCIVVSRNHKQNRLIVESVSNNDKKSGKLYYTQPDFLSVTSLEQALVKIQELEQQVNSLTIINEDLESHRPHWAMGYSKDSIAAQSLSSALSALWKLLGTDSQTTAVFKLKQLLKERL